jgi:hypothetical protein
MLGQRVSTDPPSENATKYRYDAAYQLIVRCHRQPNQHGISHRDPSDIRILQKRVESSELVPPEKGIRNYDPGQRYAECLKNGFPSSPLSPHPWQY